MCSCSCFPHAHTYYDSSLTRKEYPVVISKRINKNEKIRNWKGEYPNWKLVMRKLNIGNEKYPNWKLVMRKFKIGNGK
jgi:hypothetical protein